MELESDDTPASMNPAEIGEIIAGYRLDSLIAAGGMGSVYRATHTILGRRAAIKVLSPALAAEPAFVERFLFEARIVNEARHANIIDVFDFVASRVPPRVAYVMELLPWPTLRRALESAPLDEQETLVVLEQLVSVLDTVHAMGVVHRDLKPENILINRERGCQIKVLDFGIAKPCDPSIGECASPSSNSSSNSNSNSNFKDWTLLNTVSAPGTIIGTPAYMAPEQIDGDVSPAVDIYALGALTFEMLSGAKLFDGEILDVLAHKAAGDVNLSGLPADMTSREGFEELIALCLATDPKRRPALAQIRSRLAAIASPLPTTATFPFESPTARRRALSGIAMLGAAGLIAGWAAYSGAQQDRSIAVSPVTSVHAWHADLVTPTRWDADQPPPPIDPPSIAPTATAIAPNATAIAESTALEPKKSPTKSRARKTVTLSFEPTKTVTLLFEPDDLETSLASATPDGGTGGPLEKDELRSWE